MGAKIQLFFVLTNIFFLFFEEKKILLRKNIAQLIITFALSNKNIYTYDFTNTLPEPTFVGFAQ